MSTVKSQLQQLISLGYSPELIRQELSNIVENKQSNPREITHETLDELRHNQQKNNYGSQALQMFINGVFTGENWNGGDGIFRQFFYDYYKKEAYEVDCTLNGLEYSVSLIISHTYFEDQNYVTIVIDGNMYRDDNYEDSINDVAYFSWYKSRGRTELAKYNGEPITEEQYLLILNLLQATGFKFNLD